MIQLNTNVQGVLSTCEEDDVSVLRVLGLQSDQALEVGGVSARGVALVVWEELHHVPLLVGGQQVQQLQSIAVHPDERAEKRPRKTPKNCMSQQKLSSAISEISVSNK